MLEADARFFSAYVKLRAVYLSELRRFAKNLNSPLLPLTNSWTNRTTVDPRGVTLRPNKEGGEQFFANRCF
jgi:hypothetical protein